jgi:hypothetical protein
MNKPKICKNQTKVGSQAWPKGYIPRYPIELRLVLLNWQAKIICCCLIKPKDIIGWCVNLYCRLVLTIRCTTFAILFSFISLKEWKLAIFRLSLTRSMSWAQRLKRVFNIDITECEKCQRLNVSIIACITDASVIQKILTHLDKKQPILTQTSNLLPPMRAGDRIWTPPVLQPLFNYY